MIKLDHALNTKYRRAIIKDNLFYLITAMDKKTNTMSYKIQ